MREEKVSDPLWVRLRERSIPECFAEVVSQRPHDPAAASNGHAFSYESLDEASNKVARAILSAASAEDESVVLMIGRNALAVVGVLAILKAGKICIPLHPVNNEARMMGSVLDDHSIPIILTDGNGADFLLQAGFSARVLDIGTLIAGKTAEAPDAELRPDSPAFVIYTSGSTGAAKGVLHTHQNIVSRVFWYARRFSINENDRTLMLSAADSISGIIGMLRPLLTGGQTFQFSIRREGFEAMAKTIRERKITILPMVNSVFRHFIDSLPIETQLPGVRMIILGGEAMTIGDVKRYRNYFSDDCILLNTLGCTELPTYRYYAIDKKTKIEGAIVPAGFAVPGNEVEIVDEQGCPVTTDTTGEIIVKSHDCSLGYWKRPEETIKQFFRDSNGTPCYRTGDLGKLRKDGLLEHWGRKDSQVKILGNRVELAEIENALREHPKVANAAVATWSDQVEHSQLFANVVYKDNEDPANPAEIKSFLRKLLPNYVVPVEYISVGSLPLTRTGKVNRLALIIPNQVQTSAQNDSYQAPRSELEQRVAEICAEVLKWDAVGIQDNLFDLGANSLIIFQIVNRVKAKFAVTLPIVFIFDCPTVREISEFIQSSTNPEAN